MHGERACRGSSPEYSLQSNVIDGTGIGKQSWNDRSMHVSSCQRERASQSLQCLCCPFPAPVLVNLASKFGHTHGYKRHGAVRKHDCIAERLSSSYLAPPSRSSLAKYSKTLSGGLRSRTRFSYLKKVLRRRPSLRRLHPWRMSTKISSSSSS